MLNTKVFKNIRQSGKQILVVTKYWDSKKTQKILSTIEEQYSDVFYGLGENRIENISEKNIPRKKVHFIGNIQSKKVPDIVKYCSTIHSLSSLKHADIIEKQGINTECFIQIRLDREKENGISEDDLSSFLEACKDYKYLKIIGISGMGSIDIGEQGKRKEFQKLIKLRDTYIPQGLISAGTSIDYEIALEEGIDIVRIGNKALE